MSSKSHQENAAADDLRETTISFLHHYCTQLANPGYAVMIEGPWGSGKTWLIRKFNAELDAQNRRCLYVSLYGVKDVGDIVEQCFAQLHPLMNSKFAKRSLSVVRALAKGALKLNIDKAELSLGEIDVPEPGKSAETSGAILIFDDLERSLMPVDEIFGIINQFVEHDGNRVIVLANPAKVQVKDSTLSFASMQEKVIGRTFVIKPNASEALSAFLAELEPALQKILEKHVSAILAIFDRAGYNNLRQLRQALIDFGDLWHCLFTKTMHLRADHPFWDRLVSDVVALSIEFRAGAINSTTLQEIRRISVDLTLRHTYLDRRPTVGVHHIGKHALTNGTVYALPLSSYIRFFEQGYLNKREGSQAVALSPYLMGQDTPNWLRLWHWERLSDEEFEVVLYRTLEEYKGLHIHQETEFLQVTGLLFFFGEYGVLPDVDVRTTVKQAIDGLHAQGKISHADPAKTWAAGKPFAGLLPYWAENTSQFEEARAHYNRAANEANDQELKQAGEQWLHEFDTDIKLWASRIADNGSEKAYLAGFPIFSYITPRDFAKRIIKVDASTLATVIDALSERYLMNQSLDRFKGESSFFQEMRHNISVHISEEESEAAENEEKSRKNTLSRRYLFRQFIPLCKSIADKLVRL